MCQKMTKQLGCVLIFATSAFAADEVKSWLEGLEFKGFAFARYSGANGINDYWRCASEPSRCRT